jgi:hypothetical protein
VLERVVENWLTSVNELSMQVPFAQLLTAERYQVVHLSRHGPFEEGKDILAIAPDGVPCAFQLKGAPNGKITQRFWAKECLDQAIRLVETPIVHPSINPELPRRVYFVTNGELEEEVRLEIVHRNSDWERRRCPKLDTVVKGQLLVRFKDLHTNLWPVELTSEKTLLEFFLADGADCLQKGKLAGFILSLLPLFDEELNKAKCSRALASAAILTAYAMLPYTEKSNHVALIESWIVYMACLTALVEKHGLAETYWKDTLGISIFAIEQSFTDLCDEIKERKHLIEGEALVDAPFYRGRVTWLVGLVSAFALWKRLRDPGWEIEDWFRIFVRSHQKDLLLWGEAAMPQFLATFWFLRQITATPEPDEFLAHVIESICSVNEAEHSHGLADPYHGLAEIVMDWLGMADNPQVKNYKGRSYTLECFVHLLARRGWRQRLRFLWPQITRLHYAEFRPISPWQFCLWRSEEEGKLEAVQPKMPQSWAELRDQARQVDLSVIPELFQRYPGLLLVFILTYPHRLTKDVAKFLDDRLREVR